MATLYGNDSANTINGTNAADTIYAKGGNDRVLGNGGNDGIQGGTGDDSLSGGSGNDWLYGQDGNDKLFGDEGDDSLFGGWGNDTLEGNGMGRDMLYGERGADRLKVGYWDMANGGAENDIFDFSTLSTASVWHNYSNDIYGGDGIDTLNVHNALSGLYDTFAHQGMIGYESTFVDPEGTTDGGLFALTYEIEKLTFSGRAVEYRGEENTTMGGNVTGSAYNDELRGSAFNDTFIGGAGNDALWGGTGGHDTLTGGTGSDLFALMGMNAGGNGAHVTDFERGIDKVMIPTHTTIWYEDNGNTSFSVEGANGLASLSLVGVPNLAETDIIRTDDGSTFYNWA